MPEFQRQRLAVIPILFVFIFQGCSRQQPPGVVRLAVLAFDDLTPNARLGRIGRATAAVLTYDLSGATDLYAQAVDSRSSAYAIQATRILDGYVSEYQGRLEIRAAIEDLDRRKTLTSFVLSGPASDGLLPLLNQLAKRLTNAARSFSTANPAAFHLYGQALSAQDSASALHEYQAATDADPRFVMAYIARAEILFAGNDRAGGLQVLAEARGKNPDVIDGAEIDYLSASGAGDSSGREKALTALTRLTPANSKPLVELAEQQFAGRKFQDAVRSYEAATRLSPDDPGIWNELGYAYAQLGDLTRARSTIEHYQALAPNAANPLDSLGEVCFFLGDFANAAKYFERAHQKNPGAGGSELSKAAQARLLAGDLAGADALFEQYIALVQAPERGFAGLQRAQWEFLTGRRKGAMARIEQLIPRLEGDARSFGLCQLSIWKLETGDANSAADLADQAAAHAQSSQAHNLSATCRAIVAMGASNSGSKMADAIGLLFARKYALALPLLESTYRETSPSLDGQIRPLLAWAYIETGRVADARPLLALYPIPVTTGSDPLFASLIFPRFLYMRAVSLEKEGKRDEAKRSYQLYLKYAGDVPDIFGDEAKAHHSLESL